MPIIRTIIDKVMTRVIGRDEYTSGVLRRYFRRTYDIDIGLYTLGAFDRWRIPPGSRIGRYCSIAGTARLLDGNHPMDSLSTHPYFYLKSFGMVPGDQAIIQAPVVEDDVWLGHNSTITPGCHRIGRGAVIGAGAVVMSDVPAYAIMTGAPAKLVRYRFPPEVVDAVTATQWWLLEKPALEAALKQAPGFALTPSRENANLFLRALGRPDLPPFVPTAEPAEVAAAGAVASEGAVMDLLHREIAGFTAADLDRPIADLDIDSFGLINLRIALETLIGRQIGDRVWGAVRTPAHLVSIAAGGGASSSSGAKAPALLIEIDLEAADVSRSAAERRIQYVNMPQMALSGLSEPWTFKEMGDIHWSVLTRGLRTPSAAVADSEGARLYATFTRICFSADQPLTDIKENDRLTIDLEMTRFGAGMFFSTARIEGATGKAQARIMTSFSKFGESGSNTSLLKGQPVIPENCEISAVDALPEFAQAYRAQRASDLPAAIFECEYEILSPHDINGVGLLYFAAYPTIVDLCAARRFGRRMFMDFSTTYRDVYYYANSGPEETLVFRIHRAHEAADALEFDATLSRKSDGKVMAFVATVKRPVRSAERGKAAVLAAEAT
ncbi:LnmK family bifunctional acyltransferase/decarboxylase [Phenylobacterium sp.]|uniref:LnmK family bifunctional acyltransferase/decarboxylase n=1 Tax=Phenylobacterium sp. TaxID=1871053 RepID=UPI0025FCFB9E|nr:LnmK family bifunctional acyltransferase/decarboxylase [Phenylobacterium sp.]